MCISVPVISFSIQVAIVKGADMHAIFSLYV